VKAQLKKKLLEEFALRGAAASTRSTYMGCIDRFERHFDASAARLGAADVRAFLLHLAQERRVNPLTQNVYASALWFLHADVLRRPRVVAQMPRRKIERRTVEVLTQAEVRWAWLLKRVFAVDVTECGRCGGRMRVLEIAADERAARRVLGQLGLGPRAPPAPRPAPPGQLSLALG